MKKMLYVVLIPYALYFASLASQSDSSSAAMIMSSNGRAYITNDKPRILIIPGHEPDYGGAEFGNVYERNLVAEIGQNLQKFLEANGNYQVFITRDKETWNPVFTKYFLSNQDEIIAWEKSSRLNGTKQKAIESSTTPKIDHVRVANDVALRLYSINKWANDNNIDLMVHLHINDDPVRRGKSAGKYSGFVIYAPAEQYDNGTTTTAVAKSVLKRLSLYNPVSNLPGESGGIVDDPELIAVGANNTADSASMLIESDYIYRPEFTNSKIRNLALKDMAYQIYLGLQDFFTTLSTSTPPAIVYQPKTLYEWKTAVTGKNSNSKDVYAMQTALLLDGDFPPDGKTGDDCPHSGIFGTCTKAALKQFQKKHGVVNEDSDGIATFSLLRKIYNDGK